MPEKFNAKIFETKKGIESREPNVEELKNLEKITEQIFKDEFKIGEGEYSYVYTDVLTNTCFKVGTRKSRRDIHEEAEFYSMLTDKSKDVIVPEPYFSLDTTVNNVISKTQVHRRVLAMQRIDGANFEEILKGRKELPPNFNPEKFFKDLKDFFKLMHEEVGIFHCDIADRNIMVDYNTGRPVVIDFGNAVNKTWFTTDEIREGKQYAEGSNDLTQLEQIEQSVRMYLTNINK